LEQFTITEAKFAPGLGILLGIATQANDAGRALADHLHLHPGSNAHLFKATDLVDVANNLVNLGRLARVQSAQWNEWLHGRFGGC
jgi:hypothetical protein